MRKRLLLISILFISTRLLAETVGPVWDIEFIPNTNNVAVASYEKDIRIFNVRTGELLYFLKGHERGVRSLAVSKDGKTLISTSSDRTVKIWNLEKKVLLKSIQVSKGRETKIIFGLDEETIIGGRNLWNISTGKLIKEFREHNPINVLAVNKSNKKFINSYGNDFFIKIDEKNKFKIRSGVNSLLLDKENKLLLLGYDNGLISVRDIEHEFKEIDLWDTGDEVVTSILLYKNQIITASGNYIKFWDSSTREELKRKSLYFKGEGFITSKIDKDIIMIAHDMDRLGIYSLKDKCFLKSYYSHTDATTGFSVMSVAFDKSKNIVISGGVDGNIVIWNMKTGKKLRTIKVNK